jgi:hypothetical protein
MKDWIMLKLNLFSGGGEISWIKIIIGTSIIIAFNNCSSKPSPEMIIELNYPVFYQKIKEHNLENIHKALSQQEIDSIEKKLNVPLPKSYKKFLSNCGGFWAFGGAVQMDNIHPFKHEFKSFYELSDVQKESVKQKGGQWPPPSNGMVCFAEFFLEADGDQVLFDTKDGLINGEYPIYYYSHETHPPHVRKIADSFEQWLNEFPDYFKDEDK